SNYNRKPSPTSICIYEEITTLIDTLFSYDSTLLLPSDFPKLPYLFFYHLLNKTLNTNIQYILMLGFLNVHLISQTSFFMSIHLQSLT
ncbi:hypothetical protein ACS2TZ_32360, partial [Bacillus cereus group sp. Bce025]